MHNEKLLVVTRNAWNESSNTGNTTSNFFNFWNKDDVANVYCRLEKIENTVCKKYFRITENDLVKKILKKVPVGKKIIFDDFEEMNSSKNETQDIISQKKIYNFFVKNRWIIFLWAREILWKLGGWKTKELEKFILEFNPDIIYMPLYDCIYMHDIFRWIHSKTNAKVVLFTGDDTYTLKQFSLSPFYWINRFIYRSSVRKIMKITDLFYVISNPQKKEYEKIFKRECKLLFKGGKFEGNIDVKKEYNIPLKLVYAGNISSGRWKTLANIGQAISQINGKETKMVLDLYTLTPKTKKMLKALNIENAIKLIPPASNQEIKEALKNADILVHVDSFNLKDKLYWRLSFSTKIVDYLASARCIFAVGPKDVASMDYFIKNDAAIVSTNQEEIYSQLEKIVSSKDILEEYAIKAWKCGKKNHQIKEIQNRIKCDFEEILRKK